MFEFKAKTGAKMTKKKTRLRRKLRKINPNLVFETKKLNSKEELLKKKNFLSQNWVKNGKNKIVKITKSKDFLSQKKFNSPRELLKKLIFEVEIGAKMAKNGRRKETKIGPKKFRKKTFLSKKILFSKPKWQKKIKGVLSYKKEFNSQDI